MGRIVFSSIQSHIAVYLKEEDKKKQYFALSIFISNIIDIFSLNLHEVQVSTRQSTGLKGRGFKIRQTRFKSWPLLLSLCMALYTGLPWYWNLGQTNLKDSNFVSLRCGLATYSIIYFPTFNFEIILDSPKSCKKKKKREAFHISASPNLNTLQNHNTMIKIKKWTDMML